MRSMRSSRTPASRATPAPRLPPTTAIPPGRASGVDSKTALTSARVSSTSWSHGLAGPSESQLSPPWRSGSAR